MEEHDNHAGFVPAAAEAATLDAAPPVSLGEEVTVRGSHGHILSLNAAVGVAQWRYSPERDRQCAETVAAFIADGRCDVMYVVKPGVPAFIGRAAAGPVTLDWLDANGKPASRKAVVRKESVRVAIP